MEELRKARAAHLDAQAAKAEALADKHINMIACKARYWHNYVTTEDFGIPRECYHVYGEDGAPLPHHHTDWKRAKERGQLSGRLPRHRVFYEKPSVEIYCDTTAAYTVLVAPESLFK